MSNVRPVCTGAAPRHAELIGALGLAMQSRDRSPA